MATIDEIEVPLLQFAEDSAPGTPGSGLVRLYAKDDGLLYSKDDEGTETAVSGSGEGGGGGGPVELAYVEITSGVSVTSTSEAAAVLVVAAGALEFDGVTDIWVEFYSSGIRADNVDGQTITLVIYDGSSSIGHLAVATSAAGNNNYRPVFARRRLTPSAASHTYSIRAFVSQADGTVLAQAGGSGNQMPAFIRIVTA